MRLDRIGSYSESAKEDNKDNKPKKGKKPRKPKGAKKPRASPAPPPPPLFPPPPWRVVDGWAHRVPPEGIFRASGDALSTNIRVGLAEKRAIDALVGAMTARTGRRATQPVALRAVVGFAAERAEAFWAFVDSAG